MKKAKLVLRSQTIRTLATADLSNVNAAEGAISPAWCLTQWGTCTCNTAITWSGSGRD